MYECWFFQEIPFKVHQPHGQVSMQLSTVIAEMLAPKSGGVMDFLSSLNPSNLLREIRQRSA